MTSIPKPIKRQRTELLQGKTAVARYTPTRKLNARDVQTFKQLSSELLSMLGQYADEEDGCIRGDFLESIKYGYFELFEHMESILGKFSKIWCLKLEEVIDLFEEQQAYRTVEKPEPDESDEDSVSETLGSEDTEDEVVEEPPRADEPMTLPLIEEPLALPVFNEPEVVFSEPAAVIDNPDPVEVSRVEDIYVDEDTEDL